MADSNESNGNFLIIESIPAEATRYSKVFSQYNYSSTVVESGSAAFEALKNQQVDLLLIDGKLSDIEIDKFCSHIKEDLGISSLPIVVLTSKDESEYRLKAIESGVDGYLIKPVGDEELISQLSELIGKNKPEKAELESNIGDDEKKAMIVAIASCKGGTGVSTIVANWGYSLSMYNKKVLLIDAAGYTNHLTALLSSNPKSNFADVCRENSNGSGEDILNSSITPINNNLAVVNLVNKINDISAIRIPVLEETLKAASKIYDFILIDIEGGILDEIGMSLLQSADELQVITTYEPFALRDTSVFIENLKEFGIPESKIRLTINRANCEIGNLDPGMIQKNLKHSIFCTLPNDWNACIEASHNRMTVIDYAPKSKLTKELRVLSEHYVKVLEEAV